MAFKMNKPVIHGSKEHSALLAKAERVPTHGADPAIMAAVANYSKSNSPDVIDWQLTMNKIEIDKKEKKEKTKKEKKEKTKKVKKEEKISLEKEIDYDALFEPEVDDPDDYPGGVDDPNLTLNERKEITAENDKKDAINKLKESKKKKDTHGQYYEEGTQKFKFDVDDPKEETEEKKEEKKEEEKEKEE